MKLSTLVFAVGLSLISSVTASEEVKAIVDEVYSKINPVRVLPIDPNDENQELQCEISNAWVTVFEHIEASKDNKVRISYALMRMEEEWQEAMEKHDGRVERKETEESKAIYAKMIVLARFLQKLRAAEPSKENK